MNDREDKPALGGLDLDGRNKTASRVTLVGLAVNLVLVVIKYASGIIGGSSAMIADATHSLSDSVTDVVLLFGFFFANRPPDDQYAYGHGKVETLATTFCGAMLFLAGLGILFPACAGIYGIIFQGESRMPPGSIALVTAILSTITKESLYRYTNNAGKKLKSPALVANAWHHRSDAFSSAGTAIGIGGAIIGGGKFAILDPIAAVIVSMFIFKEAWSIMTEACQELIEASIGKEGQKTILDIIASQDGVLGWHEVKSRRIGYYIAIEAHIIVDNNLNIVQAHDIATHLEHRLRLEFGRQTHINLHVEPKNLSKH